MIKLIAIDMDGTLLNSNKEISKENIEALQRAAAKGIKIVLCTGRPLSGIMPYFEKLGLTGEEYIIMNNGATIYNTKDQEAIFYNSLSQEEVAFLESVSRDYDGIDLVLTGSSSYYVVAEEVPDLIAYDAGLVFDVAKARSLSEISDEGETIFLGMYMGEKDILEQFIEQEGDNLSQVYSTVRTQSYIYEAMPQGVTKASALKILAQHLGFNADNVMALGDAANDIEMLEYAGYSVAMGNASETIKAMSRYVTDTNDNHGVAKAIYTYALTDEE